MTDEVNRALIENGVWPLVDAANSKGYPTRSSCEGHASGHKFAHLVFFASNDDALRIHLVLKELARRLECHWELSARFLIDGNGWRLGWKIENTGVLANVADESEFWALTTEAGQRDILKLAELFKTTPASS